MLLRPTKKVKEKEPIPVDGEYFALVTGSHGKHRAFWRNLIFTDQSIATFYLEQEAFAFKRAIKESETEAKREGFDSPIAVKNNDIPKRYTIEEVYEWEVESRQESLLLYELPRFVNGFISNYEVSCGMCVPMRLHDENVDKLFYSGRFGFLGNNHMNELVIDHGASNVSHGDSMMMGIRMRPAIQAPLRKGFFSMCGDGLPGLWYINIGERIEKSVSPVFGETSGD